MAPNVRRLRRFEVMDREGFGNPVVALSGVMPAAWELVSSAVAYGPSGGCPVTSVVCSFKVASPDRTVGLELFPASFTVWFDDPSAEVMYGASSVAGGACPRERPVGANAYVLHRLLPQYRSGGAVVGVEAMPYLSRALERRAARVSSRNPMLRALNCDVSLVKVVYPGHRTEERVLVPAMVQGQSFDPRDTGGPPQQWSTYRPFAVGMWAPQGRWEQHRASFELVMASLMQDTDWLEKQTQLDVAMGRTTTKAARVRRLVWDATVELGNPTLLGALRDRESGADAFPVTLWAGGGARYALDGSVRQAWVTASRDLLVVDDQNCGAPEPGLRPLRPGAELVDGDSPEISDHDGATRLAAPRGGTLSASSGTSDTSGIAAGGVGQVPVRPARSILAQPGGLGTPE